MFWIIPEGFYGGEGDALDLTAVGKGVAAGEHLFVNTYLLGVTTFAAAGNSRTRATRPSSPRTSPSPPVARADARRRKPPNGTSDSRDFEFDRVSQIAAAAQSAGFGFGEQGTAARSLLRPPTVADGPARPDQLERAA